MMMIALEVYIVVDEEGEYVVDCGEDGAREKYDDEYGGHLSRRLVKVIVKVPLPVTIAAEAVLLEDEKASAAAGGVWTLHTSERGTHVP